MVYLPKIDIWNLEEKCFDLTFLIFNSF